MSFVINSAPSAIPTLSVINAELLEAYKSLYTSEPELKGEQTKQAVPVYNLNYGLSISDVILISKSRRIAIDSFALALSSDFFKKILECEPRRDTTNILIPDIEPEIMEKIVEYIYNGYVSLDPKWMSGKM